MQGGRQSCFAVVSPKALSALTVPSPAGEPWCPTVREISQAFSRLGADLSPLCRRRLLPPELCPVDSR